MILWRLKIAYLKAKGHLQGKTLSDVLWIVNLVPNLFGFSLLEDKISAVFWIIHFSLILYVYVLGGLHYMIKYAEGTSEFVTCYLNVSIVTLTVNNSYWWLTKRSLLSSVLELQKKNDVLVDKTHKRQEKHEKLLSNIKYIILIFFFCIYMSEILIYLPNRARIVNEYAMTPCVGMEPLTKSPNKEICVTILFVQECSIMVAVLNYQALLLLLIAHTAAMYQLLSDELVDLDAAIENEDIEDTISSEKKLLNTYIYRHCLLLEITGKLRELYSVPVGVNFGSNAVCIMLLFFLTMQEVIKFIPVLMYCFSVFFLYCFLGQKVINASEKFEMAVYGCGWEKFDVKDKQKVYNMLVQSQKPVTLLAADIIPINIATFATTCQAMYKFVTVLKL